MGKKKKQEKSRKQKEKLKKSEKALQKADKAAKTDKKVAAKSEKDSGQHADKKEAAKLGKDSGQQANKREVVKPEKDSGQRAGKAAKNIKKEAARPEKRRAVPSQRHEGGQDSSGLSETAERFRALGDEHRLQILLMLADRELCAADLLKSMDIVQSTLSHHMKILTESGIVKCRKQGKWSWYSVDSEMRELIDGFRNRQIEKKQQ